MTERIAKNGFWHSLRDLYHGASPADNNSIKTVYNNMLMLLGVVTVIILITFGIYFESSPTFALFTILAVMGAVYLGGCAICFLFAIPKSAQEKQQPTPATNTLREERPEDYNDNTSLEEISDWLTKIIVGLSLTQFNKILSKTDDAANMITVALKSGNRTNSAND